MPAKAGRQQSEHTGGIPGQNVRPQVVAALDHLVKTTGYSRAHFVRVALEEYLAKLGLVQPHELTPYPTAGDGRYMRAREK
jgi:hypothetical protein